MKIQILKSDITTLNLDAVVNAANSKLLQGSGVCGAIFKAAGDELTDACNLIGGCEAGKAVITPGYNLKAKKIIHAVAPKYYLDPTKAPELLMSAYLNSIILALENRLSSMAFPCLGTGVYGYPKEEAANIVFDLLKDLRSIVPKDFLVVLCCFEDEDFRIYSFLFRQFGEIDAPIVLA